MNKISIYKKKKKTGIIRLIEIAKTKKILLLISVLLSIISVCFQITPFLTIYLLLHEIVNNFNAIENINNTYVWQLGIFTVIGIALYGICIYSSLIFSHIAAFNILYEIRLKLTKKLTNLPLGYFNLRTRGGIKKILLEDIERIESFIAHNIPDVISTIFLIIICITISFIVDWRLAIAILFPIMIIIIMQIYIFNKIGTSMYQKWQRNIKKMNGTIVEYVKGISIIKIFNQTVFSFNRFSKDVNEYLESTKIWIKKIVTPFTLILILLSLNIFFILLTTTFILDEYNYKENVINILLFLFISTALTVPLHKLMSLSSILKQTNSGIKEIDSILSEREIPETKNNYIIKNNVIEFKNVSFSYNNKVKALEKISFKLNPGTTTALIGPSGSGKTTIINLLFRFWDIDEGEILIDGINIKEIKKDTLINHISGVFQDFKLFHDTIEENIRMGNTKYNFSLIQKAAEKAQIHDFIMNLDKKYDTIIGEGGTYLSEGEAQRISIARVILKNSPIILFDEATSYSDPNNEFKIQLALKEALKNKTVLVISHRIYSITESDQIIVFNKGKIVEQGKHKKLIKNKGLYSFLWNRHIKNKNWQIS